MKKTISFLIILIVLLGCSTNNSNEKKSSKEQITATNYLAIELDSNSKKSDTIKKANLITEAAQIKEYKSDKDNNYSEVFFNPYNNSYYITNTLNCLIKIYTNDLKVSEKNTCSKNDKGTIDNIQFSANNIIINFRLDFDINNDYSSRLLIFDNNFNLKKKINVKEEISSLQYNNEKIYYSLIKEEAENDGINNYKIISYNLNNNESKIEYQTTDSFFDDFISLNNDLIIIQNDVENDKSLFLKISNNKTVKLYEDITGTLSLEKNRYIQNNMFFSIATKNSYKDETMKISLLTYNNKISLSESNCSESNYSLSNTALYCLNDSFNVVKTNLDNFEITEMKLPYPTTLNENNIYNYYFYFFQ